MLVRVDNCGQLREPIWRAEMHNGHPYKECSARYRWASLGIVPDGIVAVLEDYRRKFIGAGGRGLGLIASAGVGCGAFRDASLSLDIKTWEI